MGRKIDYVPGQLINGTVFIKETEPHRAASGRENRKANFVCKFCGNSFNARIAGVKNGETSSCGCFKKNYPPRKVHGLRRDPLYGVWGALKGRCFKETNQDYKNYGARGITICDEWRYNFQTFYDYMTQLPHYGECGRSIDRINNDGNYEPGNMRWATSREQTMNGRKRKSQTGYTGVAPLRGKFQSYIGVNGKIIYIGIFRTVKGAVGARNRYITENNLHEYKIQQTKPTR